MIGRSVVVSGRGGLPPGMGSKKVSVSLEISVGVYRQELRRYSVRITYIFFFF